jgi:hypothetical protein
VAGRNVLRVPFGLRRSGDWTIRCQIPAARVHDLWNFLARTSFATRYYPDYCLGDSATHFRSPKDVH